MADKETQEKAGGEAPAKTDQASAAPVERPPQPAPPSAAGPVTLGEAELKAILSLPQIQEHIVNSQKPIQSDRDKQRSRADDAERVANLSDEDRQALGDRRALLADATSFYRDQGVPEDALEGVRDIAELRRVAKAWMSVKSATPSGDAASVNQADLTAAMDKLRAGTANTPLTPAGPNSVQRNIATDDDQALVDRVAKGEPVSKDEMARVRTAMGNGVYPSPRAGATT